MNELKKKRIKSVLKYTWPFYILSSLVVIGSLYFIFNVTHRLPSYKTMTLFISGEMNDENKLRDDLLNKYKEKELKSVSCISSSPNNSNYYSKLSIPGYNTADILIIPESKLNDLAVSAFGLEINDELYNSFYINLHYYEQDNVKYGIKIDKDITKEYFTLPNEDCYMVLNGKSENIGKYSKKQIVEHDTALNIVKDWGI